MSKNLRELAEYGSIGISWVMTSLLAVYLAYKGGAWVDAKLGSDPLFTLIGLITGILMSIYSLVQQLLRIESSEQQAKPGQGSGDSNPKGETPTNTRRD